jgi:hypothetical protein
LAVEKKRHRLLPTSALEAGSNTLDRLAQTLAGLPNRKRSGAANTTTSEYPVVSGKEREGQGKRGKATSLSFGHHYDTFAR